MKFSFSLGNQKGKNHINSHCLTKHQKDNIYTENRLLHFCSTKDESILYFYYRPGPEDEEEDELVREPPKKEEGDEEGSEAGSEEGSEKSED